MDNIYDDIAKFMRLGEEWWLLCTCCSQMLHHPEWYKSQRERECRVHGTRGVRAWLLLHGYRYKLQSGNWELEAS